MTKPLLIGEQNPFGDNPDFALYPAPDGCAGWRLCTVILGMSRRQYLESFDRCNLVVGKWAIGEARTSASEIVSGPSRRLILLGSKVCQAFGVPFAPFTHAPAWGASYAILPHPSGRNRMYLDPANIAAARRCVAALCPELALEVA